MDTGFFVSGTWIMFWIPIDSGIRIFDLYSEFQSTGFPIPREKIPGFQISDSLTLDTTAL